MKTPSLLAIFALFCSVGAWLPAVVVRPSDIARYVALFLLGAVSATLSGVALYRVKRHVLGGEGVAIASLCVSGLCVLYGMAGGFVAVIGHIPTV